MAERSPASDAEARFNSVVEEHGAYLRRAIVHLCPKHLGLQFDDIEQEARLRLWRGIEAEREIRDLPSYIYRIAVTTVIDATRQAKARREEQFRSEEEGFADDGPTHAPPVDRPSGMPDRVTERRLVIIKVEQILATFADDRRRAVGLYLQGMTTNEIGRLMNFTEPKARNLVYRGLADLRRQLQAEGIEYEID
jgi:RNA polymerase sigma-70 factor (ECF subfamily)